MREQASFLLADLAAEQSIDLVKQFIGPWCLQSALTVTGIHPQYSDYLTPLLSQITAKDAAAENVGLSKTRASEANKQLDLFFEAQKARSSKSVFLGVAQTVPAFLGSACAALLDCPDQTRELRRCPQLIAWAVEELLRYAGPVHTLFRRAGKEFELCEQKVGSGDCLILRLASANRDSEQFIDPNRLNVRREISRHLALSAGPHSCPGGSLVRLMLRTAIECLFGTFAAVELSGPIEWCFGTMLSYPTRLPVVLKRATTCCPS
jgi:cytochrome P450